MAIWYEVEKSEQGIYNFLECNWCFHDFTIDRIEYYRKNNIVELFMKYDELKGSVILRFIGVHALNIALPDDDYDAWLMGSTLILSDDNTFTWIAAGISHDELESAKKYATWLRSDAILWAVTDETGKPSELPSSKINQTWHIFGKIEEHCFKLKEYNGNPQLIKDLSLQDQ